MPGCFETALSTHRDTIASVLVSYRSGPFEMGAGPALAWSVTHQGDDEFLDPGHLNFGITAGLDAVLPAGNGISIVPTARYHFLFRGDERMYAGMSRSVIRVGVGVRLAK